MDIIAIWEIKGLYQGYLWELKEDYDFQKALLPGTWEVYRVLAEF